MTDRLHRPNGTPTTITVDVRAPDEPAAEELSELVAKRRSAEQGSGDIHHEFRSKLADDAMAIPDDAAAQAIKETQGIDYAVRDSAAFDEADLHVDYLIENVLADGQPAVIAGPAKALKTSLSVDLVLSLALERTFLGKFWVPKRKRVLFLSAESGGATLQETARRVALTKGCNLRDVADRAHWGDWVPRVNSCDQLALLRYEISRARPDVCVIDPLYMVVDGDDAANVAKMGQQLRMIADQCLKSDVTPILVHHTKKTSQNGASGRPLEPADLAGAGVTEYFRQWILVNRRETYDPEQPHRLWLSAGGSAGHGGAWAMDIDERRNSDGLRRWSLSVRPASEVRAKTGKARRQTKQSDRPTSLEKRVESVMHALRSRKGAAASKRDIRDVTKLSGSSVNSAIEELLRCGEIEEVPTTGTYPKYRARQSPSEHEPASWQQPAD